MAARFAMSSFVSCLLVLWLIAPICAGHGGNMTADEKTAAEMHEAMESVLHEGAGMVVCVAASLMIALLVGNVLHMCEVSIFSESMLIICIGYLLGKLLPTNGSILGWAVSDVGVEEEGLAMAGILNLFLLPIIIFEAGWSMIHRDFINQMMTILTFAVFGTLISMVVVGTLIMATCEIHGICGARVAFTYAALISAVDPVATLATYTHLQVDPLLNILVFGESVVNDAVAIVLFRVLNTGDVFADLSVEAVSGRIASQTMLLLFGSVGLGLAMGFMLMLIVRMFRLTHSTSNCVLFMFLSSFFIYSFAERVCGLSGIITVLFGAMFASGFARYQFPPEASMFCAFALKQGASLADMVVFLFVGITAVYANLTGLVLGLLVSAFCLLGRAAAVLPLALLTNGCKALWRRDLPKEKKLILDWKKIFMMWHAGLRGGIALVLTLELGPWVEAEGPGTKDKLRNATVLIIVFFLLFFGGSTKVLLRLLGIPMEGEAKPMHVHHGRMWHVLHDIRDKVLRRVLESRHHVEEPSALPQLMADFAAVERKHTSAELPPVSSAASRRISELHDALDGIETGNSGLRPRQKGMVALFGVADPLHAGDESDSDSDCEECDSDDDSDAGC
ncbi:unnamed protein product [Effrenium voratum]|nr:unnamed protein product [Effrenium voratum]CAJ1430418.1 unnamed protein product [Effrenium voratum]